MVFGNLQDSDMGNKTYTHVRGALLRGWGDFLV